MCVHACLCARVCELKNSYEQCVRNKGNYCSCWIIEKKRLEKPRPCYGSFTSKLLKSGCGPFTKQFKEWLLRPWGSSYRSIVVHTGPLKIHTVATASSKPVFFRFFFLLSENIFEVDFSMLLRTVFPIRIKVEKEKTRPFTLVLPSSKVRSVNSPQQCGHSFFVIWSSKCWRQKLQDSCPHHCHSFYKLAMLV